MNFPHTATIKSLTKSGTQYTYGSLGTTPCFLQPLSPERAQLYGLVFTKASSCWLPIDSTVVEGNRLVIDGVTYGVKGIKSNNYGTLRHKVAILEQTA